MKLILAGYGKMAQMIAELLRPREDVEILGMVHPGLFDSPFDVPGKPDAIVDFSYPGNLEGVLARAEDAGAAVVIGTTGYTAEQVASIRAAAGRVPIVHSSNYSLGVAVLRAQRQSVGALLLEPGSTTRLSSAHSQKADAPSGPARRCIDAISTRTATTGASTAARGSRASAARRSACTPSAAAPRRASTACASSGTTSSWSSGTRPRRGACLPPGPSRRSTSS